MDNIIKGFCFICGTVIAIYVTAVSLGNSVDKEKYVDAKNYAKQLISDENMQEEFLEEIYISDNSIEQGK